MAIPVMEQPAYVVLLIISSSIILLCPTLYS